jgi:hypothetical protein
VNTLVAGSAPMVAPGTSFTATWSTRVTSR